MISIVVESLSLERHMRFPCLRPAAVTVLVCALFPSAGRAQIKLPKSAVNKAAQAAGVPAPSSNARYVKKIDLTSAQIGQVNKGLATNIRIAPEIIKRWEKAQNAYDKAYADYEKKKEQYDKCVESENSKARARSEAARKKTDAAGEQVKQGMPDENAMVAQAEAAQAAAERVKNGTATAADRQTLADFQKTMAGVQGNTGAMMAAAQEQAAIAQAAPDSIKKKCGAEPTAPTLGAAAGAPAGKAGAGAPTSAAEEINQASAEAAGMSDKEYRLAMEKAMGFARSNTQVQGGADTPEDEAKAINQALVQTRELLDQAQKENVELRWM